MTRTLLACGMALLAALPCTGMSPPVTSELFPPEISPEISKLLDTLEMAVVVCDASGRLVDDRRTQFRWEADVRSGTGTVRVEKWYKEWQGNWSGEWHGEKPRMFFPLGGLKQDPGSLNYKITYKAVEVAEKGKRARAHEVVETLPVRDGESFSVTAPMPLKLVTIDYSKLQFAEDRAEGLRAIDWSLYDKKKGEKGAAKAPGVATILLERAFQPLAEIRFMCVKDKRVRTVQWEGSRKELKGLEIVLSQPDCAK